MTKPVPSFVKVKQTQLVDVRRSKLLICESTGKTGDWKNHYSPELNERIDKWIEDNLAGSDLKFVMELEHQDWSIIHKILYLNQVWLQITLNSRDGKDRTGRNQHNH